MYLRFGRANPIVILCLLCICVLWPVITLVLPAAGQDSPADSQVFLPLIREGEKNQGTSTDELAANPMIAAKVGAAVLTQLANQGSSDVIVMLDDSFVAGPNSSLAQLQTGVAAIQGMAMQEMAPNNYRRTHWYSAVPAMAGQVVTAEGLRQLAENPAVVRIDASLAAYTSRTSTVPHDPQLDISVPLIGANTWHEQGITGQGVTVAVLDSGVDTDHPDLADAVVHQECFLAGQLQSGGFPCPNGTGRQSGPGAAEDDEELSPNPNTGECVPVEDGGHGTHVTGIITANGVQTAAGVAPGAQIVAVKVLDRCGGGNFNDILSALDYLLTNRPEVKVVNMSLGTRATFPNECDTLDALTMAMVDVIRRLRERGTLVVASAGNAGSSGGVGFPACLSQIIAVGATDDSDTIPFFSNSGAELDLWAPGVEINSARRDGGTANKNGTSMSAPHVVGCAALLLDGGVANSPAALATRLVTSPVQITDSRNGRTFPRLDCTAPAVVPTPTATPSSTPPLQTPVATNTATPSPTAVAPTATPPGTGATCFGVPATMIGTDGDDVLEGTAGNDVIVGLRGNDYIVGGGGDDLICGDSGRDLLDGGPGNDQLDGGVDDDMLYGGVGADLLLGGSGNDRMNGWDGDDTAHGGSGVDEISGGAGNDLLTGGDDNDRISGGFGDDQIDGEAGVDTISGGEGVDICALEAGVDFTNGTCEEDGPVATPLPTATPSATPIATATPTATPTATEVPAVHLEVREVFIPPVIDGLLDDVWLTTYPYPLEHIIVGAAVPTEDLSAKFWALYDSNYLYVLVSVYDDQLWADSGETWWEDDVVELYLDGDLSRGASYDGVNDYQLAVRLFANNWLVGLNSLPAPVNAAFAGYGEDGWYTVEMAIPLTAVGMVAEDGYRFGLDVHVIDDDNGGNRETKLAWYSTVDDSWETPSHFGIGQLTARRKVIADGVHLEAEAFDAQQGIDQVWWSGFGYFDQGDWVRYRNVDLGAGVNTFRAQVAVDDEFAGGQIEVRLDAPNGTLAGVLTVQSTGDWDNYQPQQVAIQSIGGVHDLYFVGAGSDGIANVDWFQLRQEN